MRIQGVPPKEMISKYFHVKDKAVTKKGYSQGTDKAELTSESKTFSAALRAAKGAMSTQSSDQTDRLEALSEQIQNGEYSVSGSEVAQKILGE